MNVEISQKYLVSGQTQTECDSVHSAIERHISKTDVYTPHEYALLMRTAYNICDDAAVHGKTGRGENAAENSMVGGCIATGVAGIIAIWDIETLGGDGAAGGLFVASEIDIRTDDGTIILVLSTAEKIKWVYSTCLEGLENNIFI
ncbi:hypothetical protein PoB_003767400 [Plakobranchus ocellatus]|uniref:Uncharacterized protein n=1 Tax=Plakobranchus ocellatus TaxID=259542 RepID=A0AAV4AXR6_9GAST|nr:hypothetical protein PoB_003767400 [Plakobranchus ocellatus]